MQRNKQVCAIFTDLFDIHAVEKQYGVQRDNIVYYNARARISDLIKYIEHSLNEYDSLSALNIYMSIELSNKLIVDNIYQFVANIRAITDDQITILYCQSESLSCRLGDIFAYNTQDGVRFTTTCLCGNNDLPLVSKYHELKQLVLLYNSLKN